MKLTKFLMFFLFIFLINGDDIAYGELTFGPNGIPIFSDNNDYLNIESFEIDHINTLFNNMQHCNRQKGQRYSSSHQEKHNFMLFIRHASDDQVHFAAKKIIDEEHI